MSKREIEFPAAVKVVIPGKGQRIGKGSGIDLDEIERSEFGAIGDENRMNVGVEVIDEIAFVVPLELCGKAFGGGKSGSATWTAKVCILGWTTNLPPSTDQKLGQSRSDPDAE